MATVRSVAFGLWFRVGAVCEDERIYGISHFIEHLIFKGTRRLKANEIAERFDSLGAEVNAFTGKEYTCYHARLISDHVAEGFSLFSDMVQAPAFRKKDIDSERKVILEEIAMYEDSPDEQIHDIFVRTLYAGGSLSNIILGNAETIRAVGRDAIAAYHGQHYTLPNLVVTASGRIAHEQLVSLVERSFSSRAERKTESRLDVASREKPPAAEPRVEIIRKDTQQAHICLGFPVFGAGHPDRFALGVLDTILGGSMSSRLFIEVREKRGLAYSVYSYHSYFSRSGYIASYAGTSPNRAADVISLMVEQFKRLAEERVSDRELAKAREHLKGHLALSNENTSSRMMRLGRSILSGEEVLTIDEAIERIDAVTADDIQRVARTYFAGKPTISIIGSVSDRVLGKLPL